MLFYWANVPKCVDKQLFLLIESFAEAAHSTIQAIGFGSLTHIAAMQQYPVMRFDLVGW